LGFVFRNWSRPHCAHWSFHSDQSQHTLVHVPDLATLLLFAAGVATLVLIPGSTAATGGRRT
jgi:hypothetical protein